MNPEPPFAADLALVRGALAREPTALEAFLQRAACIPRQMFCLNRRLGFPLAAEDLADASQEAFTILWRKLESYAGQARLETWVYRFCELELLSAVNRRRRRERVESTAVEAPPEPAAEASPTGYLMYDHLHARLEKLPPVDQELIRLKSFEGATFVETAERLGMPVNSVKSRYYRALARLRDLLAPSLRQEEA